MSLAGIGLATGASMPWVLKFLWAPLVDRYRQTADLDPGLPGAARGRHRDLRRRRSHPPRRRAGALLLLYVTLSATQDIAVDAYTIETTSGRELGVANSVRIGAYRAASFVSSALLVYVAARRGWDAAFLVARGDHRRARGRVVRAAGDQPREPARRVAGRADRRRCCGGRASGR